MRIMKNKLFMLFSIAGFVVVVDQVTKWLISSSLSYYEEINVIPGFFNLIYIHNPGGAFGVFAKNQGNLHGILFILIALAAMGLVLYLYKNTPPEYPILSAGFALIFGGALGNMICVHNVIAACATVGLAGVEGLLIKRNLIPLTVVGLIAGIAGLVLVYTIGASLM